MSDLSLEDLAHAANEAVRLRARLVHDTLSLGPARAARMHGVTRQTAAKWAARYRTGGAAPLGEPARQDRRLAETRHAVLTAPLWMPTTKWSSRSIASTLGISQSSVARVWDPMRSGTGLTNRLAAGARGYRPALVGFLVTAECAVLVWQLRRDTTHAPARAGLAVQRSLRTILAADAIRHQIAHARPSGTDSFWDAVASAVDPGTTVMAVASRAPAAMPATVTLRRTCRNAGEWQSLFPLLLDWAADHPPEALHDLEIQLRAWAKAPRREFAWVAPSASRRGVHKTAAPPAKHHQGPERAVADQIVSTIRQGVADGRLVGGDRVTERYLAGRLRTTRGRVRSALRLLAADGLLTITTGHAAVVPVPTTADVTEAYAARRALGAMVIRAAVRWSPEARQSVLRSLDALRQCAATGDVQRTGDADIDFQDTLADASGLVRIAPMLHTLAEHLRMFIAVMGLDYAYPIDGILRDDRAIFAAIDAGDAEAAVALWRTKMNDAVAYMLQALARVASTGRAVSAPSPVRPAPAHPAASGYRRVAGG
ncbi:MAG TPA: FCD domain-containing protein [Rugosimonospora sp.]|nr:FCD domain-containing protein [Rugosimonospora sp.]